MHDMKIAEIALAMLASVAGLLAAWYWYKASRIQTVPKWNYSGDASWAQAVGQHRWTEDLIARTSESARLNKIAAQWTAVTVALAGISSIAAVFQ